MSALPDHDRGTTATPVFVDPTGRRRRIVRRVALAACAGVLLYLAVFVAALFGAPIPTSALIPVPGFVPVQVPATSTPPPISEEPARANGAPTVTTPSREVPASTPDRSPSAATTAPPTAATTTTAAPTSEHRNSRAPTTPPGQTRTTPPGNGR
ncbi:hypothetical protein [Amycolatopsis kentuckyensis]|uniref:hypothetical protein n=1 Tax=Amycolatopsis kentuckyensis TaxID=218823 RepID=UPI001FC9B9E6|nr:hypothetical protein [Amycolatopsis kentuckyensis]